MIDRFIRRLQFLRCSLLLIGFALALSIRLFIGGRTVAYSALAGLVFAIVLTSFSLAAGTSFRLTRRDIIGGIGGGVVLLIGPLLRAFLLAEPALLPAGNFLAWALIVSLVALAEEVFLRGTLFDTVSQLAHPALAVLTSAFLFALLHLPLYGLQSMPLDLSVGLWLGVLRLQTDSWWGAGLAHTLADLAGWWLL